MAARLPEEILTEWLVLFCVVTVTVASYNPGSAAAASGVAIGAASRRLDIGRAFENKRGSLYRTNPLEGSRTI